MRWAAASIPFTPHCIVLAVVLTILYIVAAGLMQAAWMNLFNAVMLIVGSFLAVFATGSWLSGRGGWESISDFYAKSGTAWKTSILNFSPDIIFSTILPCLILTTLMQSASQAQNQPLLAARSESDIRRGVFWASFINSMAAYPWVILALVGMAIPAIAAGGAKLSVPGLALMALPPWMVGLLMIALLSATLSTTGGLILAASHIIVHDIFKRARPSEHERCDFPETDPAHDFRLRRPGHHSGAGAALHFLDLHVDLLFCDTRIRRSI